MKKIITLILVLFTSNLFSQNEPFEYLEKLKIGKHAIIKYNPQFTTVINTKLKDLDKDDPYYTEEEISEDAVKAIKTKIDSKSNEEYIIVFSYGGSFDPEFFISKLENSVIKRVLRVDGLHLYIPGNGNIYLSGHANNWYNKRRKFKLENNQVTEIKQPYNYVGLKTKTLKPVTLYSSKQMKNVLAELTENYSIEVLLNEEETRFYLIKTDFGLIGWTKLNNTSQSADHQIDGMFYAGD